MYQISVPMMFNERTDKEEFLKALQKAGASRVFLALGILSYDDKVNEKNLALLRELVPYFQQNGLETGIWFWTFWRSDISEEQSDSLMVTSTGEKRTTDTGLNSALQNTSGFCCPLQEGFSANAVEIVKQLAKLGPDILMFDDDFRFGALAGSVGCFCDAHMQLYADKLGRTITPEELEKEIYSDKPNQTRTLWQECLGESMERFAKRIREAVDSVNPSIRFGVCSVMSMWDVDGSDPMRLAKLLAGNTKPLLRLIGAPYWAVEWENMRLQNVIELERMEYSRCREQDIEVMTEGDVYPRPRYAVPSNYLEIFHMALYAAGVGDGILKYMLDYTSSPRYETGYIERHLRNADRYEAIHRMFSDKRECGVRVYETMKKFCHADLSGIANRSQYAENLFYSQASKMLSDNGVPTCYEGNDGVGIAFGENARSLPPEALENGLILDIRAARILTEQGIDVGIERITGSKISDELYYPQEDEYVKNVYTAGMAYEVVTKPQAEPLSRFVSEGKHFVDAFRYQNEAGQRFLVYTFDAAFVGGARYRNYCMQKQLFSSIEWMLGRKMSVKCLGNPDLYVICKKSEQGMAIGLWNIFADEALAPIVELDKAYHHAAFFGCNGSLQGDKLVLDTIPPFGSALICLK